MFQWGLWSWFQKILLRCASLKSSYCRSQNKTALMGIFDEYRLGIVVVSGHFRVRKIELLFSCHLHNSPKCWFITWKRKVRMTVCICVHVCVCVYVCMYACMYVRPYVWRYITVYLHLKDFSTRCFSDLVKPTHSHAGPSHDGLITEVNRREEEEGREKWMD